MVAGNCLSPVVALNLMSLRAASSFAIGDQHGNRVERLRDLNLLFQQPHAPASLQGAARLHRQLADRGHAIRALAGLPGRTPALGTPATFAEGAPARQRNGIFSPDAYGGDPTGHRDSSAAMDAALGAMARQCQQPGGHLSFNVTSVSYLRSCSPLHERFTHGQPLSCSRVLYPLSTLRLGSRTRL